MTSAPPLSLPPPQAPACVWGRGAAHPAGVTRAVGTTAGERGAAGYPGASAASTSPSASQSPPGRGRERSAGRAGPSPGPVSRPSPAAVLLTAELSPPPPCAFGDPGSAPARRAVSLIIVRHQGTLYLLHRQGMRTKDTLLRRQYLIRA